MPREAHTASLIRDTITKEVYVAVVGGERHNSKPIGTTEILRNDKWSLGK